MLLLGLRTSVIGSMSTQGVLYVNGKRMFNTLEPIYRHPFTKVNGKTAIPSGVYDVVYRHSSKFKGNKIALNDVPYFSGILMHEGNTARDTQGCILVGKKIGLRGLEKSKIAIEELESIIVDAQLQGKRVRICVARCDKDVYNHPAYFGIAEDEYRDWF